MKVVCWCDCRRELPASARQAVAKELAKLAHWAEAWAHDEALPGLDAMEVEIGLLGGAPRRVQHPDGRPWRWPELSHWTPPIAERRGCVNPGPPSADERTIVVLGAVWPSGLDWLAGSPDPLVVAAFTLRRDDPLCQLPGITVCRRVGLKRGWSQWLGRVLQATRTLPDGSTAGGMTTADAFAPVPAVSEVLAGRQASLPVRLPAGLWSGGLRITAPTHIIGHATEATRIVASSDAVLEVAAPLRLEHLSVEHTDPLGIAISVLPGGSLDTRAVAVQGAVVGLPDELGWQLPGHLAVPAVKPGQPLVLDLLVEAPAPTTWSAIAAQVRVEPGQVPAGRHRVRVQLPPGVDGTWSVHELRVASPRFIRTLRCSVPWDDASGLAVHRFHWDAARGLQPCSEHQPDQDAPPAIASDAPHTSGRREDEAARWVELLALIRSLRDGGPASFATQAGAAQAVDEERGQQVLTALENERRALQELREQWATHSQRTTGTLDALAASVRRLEQHINLQQVAVKLVWLCWVLAIVNFLALVLLLVR